VRSQYPIRVHQHHRDGIRLILPREVAPYDISGRVWLRQVLRQPLRSDYELDVESRGLGSGCADHYFVRDSTASNIPPMVVSLRGSTRSGPPK
jgi:hypothetical protein